VQMEQSQFEIEHISETVGLLFQGADFVVEPFYSAGSYAMFKVIQYSRSVRHYRFAQFHQVLNAAVHRIFTPLKQEFFPFRKIGQLP